MKFYTNVLQSGGYILYRGYDNGRRVSEKIKFKPTLYFESEKPNPLWTSLIGNVGLEPKVFNSIFDAKDHLNPYCSDEDDKLHLSPTFGTKRWVSQFIQQKFPDEINFDRDLVNVATIDIEVMSNDGFPEPSKAAHEVITIAVKNNIDNTYYVWGTKPYDTEKKLISAEVKYGQFVDEQSMLKAFVAWWSTPRNTPDIVTGWNSRFFDIPYLCNRISALLSPNITQLLSPWKSVIPRMVNTRHGENLAFDIAGITQLDYMDLFRKFTTHTYGNQESYKLGSIANIVLGDNKLSYQEHGTLDALYKNDYQLFVDYNIKDVEIVDRLEDKLGLITLALTISYIGGVNYTDTLGTTAIWESIIYRDLMRKAIVPSISQTIPSYHYAVKGAIDGSESGTTREASHIAGGYVKSPMIGLHNWVCSFDLNSLYPNLIIQYNMSPETILPKQTSDIDVDTLLKGFKVNPTIPGATIAANGVLFNPARVGVIPRIIREIYDRRVTLKKEMLVNKKRFEKIDLLNKIERYKCEREISRLENQQIAVKILLNSLYGALGNKHFLYYDTRIAEGTTLSGQLAIRSAELTVNSVLNDLLKTTNKDYVIAIDTDSVYVAMDMVVKHFNPKNPVKFLDEFCSKMIEPAVGKMYDGLAKRMSCSTNRMVMKREAIADRGIWTAKKRYILNVHNNEGVQYAEPKIKVMGIESVKSSTPSYCRKALKHMFSVIMTKTEKDAQKEISNLRDEFYKLPADQIAFPRSVTDIALRTNENGDASGNPMHVRAAQTYNNQIESLSLQKKYPLIKNGDKIKFVYLKTPNTVRQNTIGFVDVLPKELMLDKYIDYDIQFQKTFLDPLEPIFNAINWRLEKQEETASLQSFFTF